MNINITDSSYDDVRIGVHDAFVVKYSVSDDTEIPSQRLLPIHTDQV
jgi:hypothetical protein